MLAQYFKSPSHVQRILSRPGADPSVKLEALEAIVAPGLRSGRFKATDELIASLNLASLMRRKRQPN